MSNVVKDLRTFAGLTQEQLAERAGVSTLFVIRAEQGLHVNLSPKLVKTLASITRTEAADIVNKYSRDRERIISEFAHRIQTAVDYRAVVNRALDYAVEHYAPVAEAVPKSERSAKHPFALFRTYLFEHYDLPSSQIKFCIYTGLHPAILSTLENRRDGLTPPVVSVLTDVLDLNDDQILLLRRLCDDSL